MMQSFLDALAASPAFLLVVAVAVVVAVGLLLAGAQPPRWLRARRELTGMLAAYSADVDSVPLPAMPAAEAIVASWGDAS